MSRGHPSLSSLRSGHRAAVAPEALSLALMFGLSHWASLFMLQCANFGRSLLPIDRGTEPLLAFVATVPRLQGQNIIATTGVALVALAASGGVWRRRCFFAAYSLFSTVLLLDQISYRYFFDHFRPSVADGVGTIDPRLMLSSLAESVDRGFTITALLMIAMLAGVGVVWLRTERQPRGITFPSRSARLLAAPLLLLAFTTSSERYPNLHIHPCYPFIQELFTSRIQTTLSRSSTGSATTPDLRSPGAASIDPRLPSAAAAVRKHSPQPNVVLIVLESVGALQLLGPDGLPEPTVTPHLAELAQRGVLFDSLYSVFPATVRTHIALNTGGYHPTWSSVYDLFGNAYTGPTLARSFEAAGWKTALFSSERLDGEAMDLFIDRTGFGKVYDFAKDRANHTRTKILSTWGAREEHTLSIMEPWLREQANARQPFFLTYLTVATHHPYTVPPEAEKLSQGKDNFSRYRNAQHYTDAAIGQLLDLLKNVGVRENTVIAITGDHGQAFGDRHPRNFTHRNFLYEENIRSFLLVSHPAIAGPLVSNRLGRTGDILPTLYSFCDDKQIAVPGRALTKLRIEPEIACFHKNAYPEQWGLRDRSWKFIESIRDHRAELYDLSTDPGEQVNLAARNPEQVKRYSALCEQWFMDADRQFTHRMDGYRPAGDRTLSADDLRTPGPKALTTGYRLQGELGPFTEYKQVHPTRPPIAWTRWTVYEQDTPVTYEWTAPSGAVFSRAVTVHNEWSTNDVDYPGPLPMESGEWQVAIRRGNDTLLTTRFQVSPDAPLDADQGR